MLSAVLGHLRQRTSAVLDTAESEVFLFLVVIATILCNVQNNLRACWTVNNFFIPFCSRAITFGPAHFSHHFAVTMFVTMTQTVTDYRK